MSETEYKTFEEFYPYYLAEHSKTGTRITHFIGTTAFFVLVITSVVFGPFWYFLLGIIAAYGWAWVGHFFIEKNKPATFQYPLFSLRGDFKMYFEILTGKEKINTGK